MFDSRSRAGPPQRPNCTELIHKGIQLIGQKARLDPEDARRCRDVMHAYRALATAATLTTEQDIKLWTKEHKRHRGVHESETSDLLMQAGMEVSREKMATVKRCKSQLANAPKRVAMREVAAKKADRMMRKGARRASYDDSAKQSECKATEREANI